MDHRIVQLETELNFLREQVKLKDDYIHALEYAMDEIRAMISSWDKPLKEVKADGGQNVKTNGLHRQ